MKDLRTTFYDLRGYFIPGSIMLWGFLELLDMTGYMPTTHAISILSPSMKAVLFVIIAYTIGHVIHGIANFTIDRLPFASYPPKDYFNGRFQKDFPQEMAVSLYKAVADKLGIQAEDASRRSDIIRDAYWMCFQYVMNCQNVETENFLGMTGFYRGMATALFVTVVVYIGAFVLNGNGQLGIIAFCSLLGGGLFLARARRFNYYLVKTVYSNFLHLYNDNKPISS